MKARIGPRTITLTLTEGERRALMDVLKRGAELDRERASQESNEIRQAVMDGNADFALRVWKTLDG